MPNDQGTSQEPNEEKSTIDPQELTKLVNSAVSSQLKRAMAGLPDMLKKAVAEAIPPKSDGGDDGGNEGETEAERVARKAAKKAAKAAAATTGGDPADTARKAVDDARTAEFAAMQKRLDKHEADLKDARKATAQANRRAAEEKGYASVRTALAKGIPEGTGLNAAIDLLRSRGQIVIDDEGNAKMKLRAVFEQGLDEEERELALADAVPHYLKTPDAALFMPAPSRAGIRPPPAVRPPTRPASGQPTGNKLVDVLTAEAERLSGGKPLNETIIT